MGNSDKEYDIQIKEELSSTNVCAAEMLKEFGSLDKTVVVAKKQLRGKGQRNSFWESEPNKNLTLSIIYKPSFFDAANQFVISEVIALGVCDYLSRYIEHVKIKWPNDIYVRDNKIAGILIEHIIKGGRVANSICGIGLNINQDKFVSDAPNPISLKQITEVNYDIDLELDYLLDSINARYKQLEAGQFDLIRQDYHINMYRKDGYHSYKEGDEIFNAKVVSVNELGQLILERRGGEQKTYNFKEVSFIV